jgi:hypothetical protein
MLYCVIKRYIDDFLKVLDKQIPYEKQKAQEDMYNNNLLDSNKYIRYKYPAYFFLFEVCILFFFLFSIIQFTNLLPQFIERLSNLTDPPHISNSSYVAFAIIDKQNEIIKQSWEDWYKYFYLNQPDRMSEINQSFIDNGNSTRPFWNFFITNIFPTLIFGYFIWVVIKYYQYVIAAVWGFFIMLYSFMTKKIECTMGGKWYIRLVTGWKKCNVSFSTYFNKWYEEFILRPIKQQHINYRKAYDSINSPNSYAWNGITFILSYLLTFLDYIVVSLQSISSLFNLTFNALTNTFYIIIDYIKQIYYNILKLFGFSIPSKTKTGEPCVCEKSYFKNKNDTCKENIYFDILVLLLLFYIIYHQSSLKYTIQNFINQYNNESKNIIIVLLSSTLAILFYSLDIYLHY